MKVLGVKVAGRGLRLLSIGRHLERKGVGIVDEALAHLPGVELVVAGGPPRDELDTDLEAAGGTPRATAQRRARRRSR